MKKAYEEKKRKAHKFKAEDKLGPFKVEEHIGDLDYCLNDEGPQLEGQ
uniref:Uncharacterized protein n=1 Tax=Moniliophthora roreri TaxID=221103 RepID=A0A0W0FWQ7_MONRR